MKTIHVFCTIPLTDDEYSKLLNSEHSLSIRDIMHQTFENGESCKIVFSDPLILIPLPPTK